MSGLLRLQTGHFELFHVFGNHVDLDIDDAAGGVAVHDGALPGVGGNPEFELIGAGDVGHGEGDTVDGDAAFVDDIAHVFLRYADANHVVLPHGGDAGDAAGGIDMAHDEVATEAAVAAHGALQVAEGAHLQLPQAGDAQGLGEEVELHMRAFHAVPQLFWPWFVYFCFVGNAAVFSLYHIANVDFVGEHMGNGIIFPKKC